MLTVDSIDFFSQINPYHTIPTLIDHEKDGLMLFEFRAIMTYLVNKTSPGHKLYPCDPVERALIDQSLFFEAGSFVPAQAAVVCGVFMGRGINREKIAVYETKLRMLDKMLDGKKYIAGGSNRTIADISMMTMLAGESVFKVVDMANYSNIDSWFRNLRVEIPYNDKLEAMMDALKPFTMK